MHLKLQQLVLTFTKCSSLLFVCIVSAVSFSATADYKSDIVESCQQYQAGVDKEQVNACKLYIDGFIDAAVLTNNAAIVDQNSSKESKTKSAFLQRVYQTRLNSNRQDSFDYQFCLQVDEDRKHIASKIAKALDISDLASKPLKRVLSETLTSVFPCKKLSDSAM
ncbi:hypothetical protein [Paraglaciecola sp.]|uniref:hypothetical protein n=1 Tax=Paraglaciecola sp. TaxID=1920173 RepID=UPI003EF4D8D2